MRDACNCENDECACDPGWCGCPQETCETCGVKGYGTDGPFARQPKVPALVEVDGLYYCEACDRRWRIAEAEDAREEAEMRAEIGEVA